ncbi:hypothetical protein [Acanthamoeba polyphaga mimivirus]|uniref:Uncharacterized protein n=3 Tax=Megamimivirinae TaxID=3044648 RepID=A0A2L2DN35_MIMIV|nr:hypothetical protein MegaChil _gp0727 [Megavirus chiliensis]AEQ33284.1 hypothetical protein [Megavirus chiliensis]AVG46449.1 hypothetical protein [Acanthamoeba polyphaga mimivirus]AVG47562.1 hypothetical protein [Acanthamoeba polyphaga mimivirus]AVL94041.1 hypothetical protein mvi_681 [Megavirus vitis]
MSVDRDILLYHIVSTFDTIVSTDLCKNSKKLLKDANLDLSIQDKIYYTNYSLKIVQKLVEHVTNDLSLKIKGIEINTEENHEIVHDFRIICSKNHFIHVSMNHKSINVNDIIPEKLMKICGYKKNTNMYKTYTTEYQEICERSYKKIKSHEKYSELDDKLKNKMIITPITQLVFDTLSKKRKCAENIYNHLYKDGNRIVLRLYKNRFRIYDLNRDIDGIKSFGMKMSEDNEIIIKFNNEMIFNLKLRTNASDIKERLSVKFRTTFKNLDELFVVCDVSVST